MNNNIITVSHIECKKCETRFFAFKHQLKSPCIQCGAKDFLFSLEDKEFIEKEAYIGSYESNKFVIFYIVGETLCIFKPKSHIWNFLPKIRNENAGYDIFDFPGNIHMIES